MGGVLRVILLYPLCLIITGWIGGFTWGLTTILYNFQSSIQSYHTVHQNHSDSAITLVFRPSSAHLPHSQKENDMLGWMQVHPLYRMITGYIVCIWTKSIICHVVMEHQHYMPLAPWTHSDIHQDFRLDGIVHSSNRSKVVWMDGCMSTHCVAWS